MARKKVKLAWIADASARKATFKKRRKGLMKKVSELSVLCDVQACAIVYGHEEAQPEVWPSPSGAMNVLARFSSMSEMEQSKKMMNQEGFLRQRNARLQEQLCRHERENRELEASLMLYQALGGHGLHAPSIEDVTCLEWLVEMKAKAVNDRIESVKKGMTLEMVAHEMNPLEVAMKEIQRQECLREVMNNHEDIVFGAEEMMQRSVDYNNPLLHAYFPLN